MRRTIACLIVLLSPTFTACGAIFNGTRQTVQVQSAPDGAAVETVPPTGSSTTPTSLNLERKHSYTLTFAKEGYRPATFQIQNKVQAGIVILDVLLTGLIGVVVDAATGAWYKLSPETATVALTAADGSGESIEITVTTKRENGRHLVSVQSDSPGVTVHVDRK